MSGKFVLKNERNRYRFTLQDEKGTILFTSPFLGQKERALSFIKIMSETKDIENHFAPVKGPDGTWALRGEIHSSKEGEKGNWSDGTPLGFSPSFKKESDLEKARQQIVDAAKGGELVDES